MPRSSPHPLGDVVRRGDERRRPAALVAALAARQHHLVTFRQLLALGLTAARVDSWVRAGRLHPVHRGVYAVGVPPTTQHARWMAAVLATDGVLADRSAAALWQLWANDRSEEHVIAARTARHDHHGVRVHRPRRFDPADAVVLDAIRVTTPSRTLLDLAATHPPALRPGLQEARVRRLVDDDALRDVLARHPTHKGARRLGWALTGPFTRSALERRFLRLCDEHGLPSPRPNARLLGDEVDALFDGLAVELDGRQHAGAWAKDAAKDVRLRAAGLTVLRLTWWDVTTDAARTADRVRTALGDVVRH